MTTRPWIRAGEGRGAANAGSQSIVGSVIVGATYLRSPYAEDPPQREAPGVDEIENGVQLRMQDGREFRVLSLMDDPNEGLAFGRSADVWTAGIEDFVEVDASDRPAWSGVIGRRVTGLGQSWNVPNEGAGEAIRAVQLELSDGGWLGFALGEIVPDQGQLTYMPDTVLVIFRRDVAASYRPLGLSVNAAGDER